MRADWLYNILRDGSLVDNRSYQATTEYLSDNFERRVGLEWFGGSRRTRAEHFEDYILDFLQFASTVHGEPRSGHMVILKAGNYEHNTADPLIRLQGTDARNFQLQTGNLVGFVKRDEYALKISSRFGDRFLRYIIADADGFLELKDRGGEQHEDDYGWLLAFLWNVKFRRACRLGLPKEYVSRTERLPRPRGNLDLLDYSRNRQLGRFACTYREHSFQNPAVSLIVAAYDAMERKEEIRNIVQPSRNLYRAFLEANAGSRRTRQELLETRPFANPFYNDYNEVIDLSKRVLRNQTASIGGVRNTSAFLFDVSMLFEYFVRKLLQRSGCKLLPKSKGDRGIPRGLLSGRTMDLQPDIVFEHDDHRYLFDVKYKSFHPDYGVSREDLFQMHTYLGQFSNGKTIRACGLIYPMRSSRWDEMFASSSTPGMICSSLWQQGKPVDFITLFLRIPEDEEDFFDRMRDSCKGMVGTLRRYVGG